MFFSDFPLLGRLLVLQILGYAGKACFWLFRNIGRIFLTLVPNVNLINSLLTLPQNKLECLRKNLGWILVLLANIKIGLLDTNTLGYLALS